jgi:uncharacterized protein involved in exopolysaccharide biosynthesis
LGDVYQESDPNGMSVQQPDVYAREPRVWTDDEIDLRRYAGVVLAWWREIVLLIALVTLLVASALLLWQRLRPPLYAAASDVVIARLTSQVKLDERVDIASELQDSTTSSWRASLLQLATNPAIAEAVMAALGDELAPELRTVADLLGAIEVEIPTGTDVRTSSDIIRFTATTDDPEQAAQIANAWAAEFVAQINQIYGQVPADTIASVEGELAESEARYQAAQAAYEQYIATSQADSLQRRIDEKVALRTNLQNGRNQLLAAVAEKDRTARLELFTELASSQITSTNFVFEQRLAADRSALARLYNQRRQVINQLDQARNLVDQIAKGGENAADSSALALQLLKLQIFAFDSGPSTDVNVSFPFPTAPVTYSLEQPTTFDADALAADAEALVKTLEEYLATLNQQITTTSDRLLGEPNYPFLDRLRVDRLAASAPLSGTTPLSATSPYAVALYQSYQDLFNVGALLTQIADLDASAMPDPLQQTLARLDTELQTLRSQLAAEQARGRQLAQQRDLAWTTYDTLSNKLVELNLARTATSSEVRLGMTAVTPARPVPPQGLLLPVAAAGIAATLLALVLAFGAHALGRKPLLARS